MDEKIAVYHYEGADLAIESARALFKVATKSSEIAEYGIARSLYILAGEEAVKSFTIASQVAQADNKRTEGWDKFFKDHKTKHDGLKMATFLMNFSLKNFEEHMTTFGKMGLPQHLLEQNLNSDPILREELKWFKKLKANNIKLEEATAWWEQANLEKNRGLYLGEKDNTWLNPRSVTREKAKEGEKYVGLIIEFIGKVIKDLRSPEIAQLIKDNPIREDENKNIE